jgi:nitrogen fixation protein NifU and related proteins
MITMDEKMYQEELLEHFKNVLLQNPDFYAEEKNPSCGDELTMTGIISGDVLMQIGFQGRGCVISQATASMLTEECLSKKLDEVLVLTSSDITRLIGITLGPVRLRCALLALHVLRRGIMQFKTSNSKE